MSRYRQPEPRLDVAWDSVPEPVRTVVKEASRSLVGKVSRGKVSESHSVYRVTLYVRNSDGELTHGLRVVVSYEGKCPRYSPIVRFDGKWLAE